jgi:hypothetical protein
LSKWKSFSRSNAFSVNLGRSDGVQYLSSPFSFNNTRHFNEFAYFLRHETDVMAGSIAAKIKEFVANYGNPSRLIIHF